MVDVIHQYRVRYCVEVEDVVEHALDEVGITVNKNTVPGDPQSPFVTSGIRIGTPAMTTRGMKEVHMVQIANWISDIILSPDDESLRSRVSKEVKELTVQFPLYPELG